MGARHGKPSEDRKDNSKRLPSKKDLINGPSPELFTAGTSPGKTDPRGQDDGSKRPLPPPPPPKTPKEEAKTVLAMYDFDGINNDDLSFKKGDRLKLDSNNQEGDWWIAVNQRTGKKGYIPCNYVCQDDNSLESQDWWFECDRKKADRLLAMPGNGEGTFLVRKSSDHTSLVLSVLMNYGAPTGLSIKHYKIRALTQGGYCISARQSFRTVVDLIKHYRECPSGRTGLCTRLIHPCPRERPKVLFRELEVAREFVKLGSKLGAGCFGDVFQGKLHGVIDVAIKTLKPGTMTSEAFLREAKLMHSQLHDNLVQLLAVCTLEEPIWIITELMVHGSLLDYLRNDAGAAVTFAVIVDMAAQISDAMSYLERKNFVHRDLRAANILVGEGHEVKVADFGLARVLETDGNGETFAVPDNSKFPLKWTAPEAASQRMFTTKSDVWSFGVLLYEMITLGRVPYPGMSGMETLTKIREGYRMERPVTGKIVCSEDFYDIMSSCWKTVPDQRPTFEYLHSIFVDYIVSTEESYDDSNRI